MTTRTGSRIYRGTTAALPPGACPHCGRADVTLTLTRRRMSHTDPATGVRCTGSGIVVDDGTEISIDLAEIGDVVVYNRPPLPSACPDCGTCPPGRPRADGRLRRHRIRNEDPTAPWCSASPMDRTD